MPDDASFGRWLQQRRRALGFTQEDLGRQVGIARATIRKIEADERRPSHETARRLAGPLNIAADEIPIFVRFARGEASRAELSAPAEQGKPASWRPLAAPPTNLPTPPTVMIGRTREAEAAQELLLRGDVRLVTLTGPGGVGKTRLGLAVEWRRGDLLAGVERADAVVSNPPYVEVGARVPAELGYEPVGALLAGETGLEVYERLAPAAAARGAAFVAFEVGRGQAGAVAGLLRAAGYDAVETVRDLAGIDRVVVGRR
jgi:transcriptional regulator with XRE-family HTH domain